MSDSQLHSISNPDASSFHDRDRNQLRAVIERANAAINDLIDVGAGVRDMHTSVEAGEGNIERTTLDVLHSTFKALDELRVIVRCARDVLADHEVSR